MPKFSYAGRRLVKFTILGGRGFIGSSLSAYLQARGHEVYLPARDFADVGRQPLGHVVYAIGLTGDFRNRPFDTVEAHVCLLSRLLQTADYDSWLFLSSTRAYGIDEARCDSAAREDQPILIVPSADSLYDLSKLLGEALCLAQRRPTVRVARLSNVFGPGQSQHTFLASMLRDVKLHGRSLIEESPDSSKDYVAVGDVLPLLESISLCGKQSIYNVGSGVTVTHRELASRIEGLTGAKIAFAPAGPRRIFPPIDISRIVTEFGVAPGGLLANLEDLFVKIDIPCRVNKT